MDSVTPQQTRDLKGRRVHITLDASQGAQQIQGLLTGCLESADGLVVYVQEDAGKMHTVHYQHIGRAVTAP